MQLLAKRHARNDEPDFFEKQKMFANQRWWYPEKGVLKLKGKFFWNICHQPCLGHYDKCLGLQAWPEATFHHLHLSSWQIHGVPGERDIPEKPHFRNLGSLYQKRREKIKQISMVWLLSSRHNRIFWSHISEPIASKGEQDKQVKECQSLRCGYFISVVCVLCGCRVGVKSINVQLLRGTAHQFSIF